MTLIGLLIAACITAVIVWLLHEGKIPSPFHWIVIAIVVVFWLIALAASLGLAPGLNQQIW